MSQKADNLARNEYRRAYQIARTILHESGREALYEWELTLASGLFRNPAALAAVRSLLAARFGGRVFEPLWLRIRRERVLGRHDRIVQEIRSGGTQ